MRLLGELVEVVVGCAVCCSSSSLKRAGGMPLRES